MTSSLGVTAASDGHLVSLRAGGASDALRARGLRAGVVGARRVDAEELHDQLSSVAALAIVVAVGHRHCLRLPAVT